PLLSGHLVPLLAQVLLELVDLPGGFLLLLREGSAGRVVVGGRQIEDRQEGASARADLGRRVAYACGPIRRPVPDPEYGRALVHPARSTLGNVLKIDCDVLSPFVEERDGHRA